MVERDLVWRREVADVDHMDVAARGDTDGAGSFLTNERVTLLAGDAVVKPPDVVNLPAYCLDIAERNGIRHAPIACAADVPDRNPLVPERGHENSIAHEHVVHVWTAHHRGEDLR